MSGSAPSNRLFREMADTAADLVEPQGDQWADAERRRYLTRTVVARALERAVQ